MFKLNSHVILKWVHPFKKAPPGSKRKSIHHKSVTTFRSPVVKLSGYEFLESIQLRE